MVLLVALAVGLGVAVSAQERALREGSARAADAFDLLIGARGSEVQLVLSTVYLQPAAIELIPARLLVELARQPRCRLRRTDRLRRQLAGSSDRRLDRRLRHAGGHLALAEGRLFQRLDEVVIGADVPLALGDRFSPAHGQVASDEEDPHEITYGVAGRLPRQGNPWDQAIIAPIEAVWWLHGLPVGHALDEARVWPAGSGGEPDLSAVPLGPPWQEGELPGVPAIVVKPASFAAAYGLRSAYRSAERGTMAVFPAEVLVQLYARLGDVRDLVAAIALLTQVLVIGAILLAVLASLAQRRRLIGVVRALGASRAFVFATVWLDVAVTLVAGAVSGILLGWAGAYAVSAQLARRTSIALPVAITTAELKLVALVVIIAMALAVIPAILAYRESVAAALRG